MPIKKNWFVLENIKLGSYVEFKNNFKNQNQFKKKRHVFPIRAI